MALVVETGSGDDASANSFADLTFIREYNTSRGRTLSAEDAVVEALAIRAMDYLIAQEDLMKGWRTYGTSQPLPYPRQNVVVIEDEYLSSDEIPTMLKNAQAELAYQISAGYDPMQTRAGAPVKRRRVGPIETEFFGPNPGPFIPQVLAWIAPLLRMPGQGLRTHRI